MATTIQCLHDVGGICPTCMNDATLRNCNLCGIIGPYFELQSHVITHISPDVNTQHVCKCGVSFDNGLENHITSCHPVRDLTSESGSICPHYYDDDVNALAYGRMWCGGRQWIKYCDDCVDGDEAEEEEDQPPFTAPCRLCDQTFYNRFTAQRHFYEKHVLLPGFVSCECTFPGCQVKWDRDRYEDGYDGQEDCKLFDAVQKHFIDKHVQSVFTCIESTCQQDFLNTDCSLRSHLIDFHIGQEFVSRGVENMLLCAKYLDFSDNIEICVQRAINQLHMEHAPEKTNGISGDIVPDDMWLEILKYLHMDERFIMTKVSKRMRYLTYETTSQEDIFVHNLCMYATRFIPNQQWRFEDCRGTGTVDFYTSTTYLKINPEDVLNCPQTSVYFLYNMKDIVQILINTHENSWSAFMDHIRLTNQRWKREIELREANRIQRKVQIEQMMQRVQETHGVTFTLDSTALVCNARYLQPNTADIIYDDIIYKTEDYHGLCGHIDSFRYLQRSLDDAVSVILNAIEESVISDGDNQEEDREVRFDFTSILVPCTFIEQVQPALALTV